MKRHVIIPIAIIAIVIYSFLSSADTKPLFKLHDPGAEKVVDYEKYGTFSGVGTFDYKYTITDPAGLERDSGEGIDPNSGITQDPEYQKMAGDGALSRDPWRYAEGKDPQAGFYVWATTTKENPGVRLYYTGHALEDAGLYEHALKAYRAAMILYPDTYCYNKLKTWTWLIAPAAWDSIVNLTRMHPEIGLKLTGAYIEAEGTIKGDPTKNKVAVTPGKFILYTAEDRARARADISKQKVIQRRGGRVACVKYSNGQWGIQVDGKPFVVRGVYYGPTKTGHNYAWNWMKADQNSNGINDVAYETWVDKNNNNERDADEPSVGDFKLLKEMGCNTIRIMNTLDINKELLRDLYKNYGIMVLVCDPFGAYTVHSMASWQDGTDYTNPDQRRLMKEAALKTAMELKDEEWLLSYVLGNENNLPADYTGVNASRTQASIQPKEYAEFLNEVAAEIHKIDPNHPVGVGNLQLRMVNYYAKYSPELDFIGVNDYPGPDGFGALWTRARRLIDRPILITEYGCDAYWTNKGVDEAAQAGYHKNGWEDIEYNLAGSPGEGNALGGIIFEWLDEWWKDQKDSPESQASRPTSELAFPDGWSQEEFLGIAGQGDGRHSPFQRNLRETYYLYQKIWNGK